MSEYRVCYLQNGARIPPRTLEQLEDRSSVEVVPVDRPDSVPSVDDRDAVLLGPELSVEDVVSELEQQGVFDPVVAVIDDQSLAETQADEAIHERTAQECPAAAADRIESVVALQTNQTEPAPDQFDRIGRLLDGIDDCFETATDGQSTAEFVETVCTQLSERGLYQVAAYYEYDIGAESATLNTVEGELASSVRNRLDAADVRQRAATAIHRGEPAVLESAETQAAFPHEPGSLLLLPIVRGDVPFGSLGVSAEHSTGFGELERLILSTFGGALANVLVSIQQQRALTHGHSVEVEIELEGDEQYVVVLSDRDECWAELDGILIDEETGAGTAFVRTTGSRAAIEAVAEDTEWVSSVSIRSADGNERLVELAGTRIPLVENMAEHGAKIQKATAKDGTGRLVIAVPSETEIKRLLPLVSDENGTAELVSRRDRSESVRGLRQFRQILKEELTERQHEVLLVAYHCGFFEWPRDQTGEQVAEMLDIAQPTFHEHLRTAQRTLLETVFEEDRSLYTI